MNKEDLEWYTYWLERLAGLERSWRMCMAMPSGIPCPVIGSVCVAVGSEPRNAAVCG